MFGFAQVLISLGFRELILVSSRRLEFWVGFLNEFLK
jgi:hypothetical protein